MKLLAALAVKLAACAAIEIIACGNIEIAVAGRRQCYFIEEPPVRGGERIQAGASEPSASAAPVSEKKEFEPRETAATEGEGINIQRCFLSPQVPWAPFVSCS